MSLDVLLIGDERVSLARGYLDVLSHDLRALLALLALLLAWLAWWLLVHDLRALLAISAHDLCLLTWWLGHCTTLMYAHYAVK